MALYGAFPLKQGKAGEGEAFFNTIRLTTNVGDNNLPFDEEQGSSSDALATHGMIEEDNVKALMWMGNERVAQVKHYKKQCTERWWNTVCCL